MSTEREKHQAADALSRICTSSDDTTPLNDDSTLPKIDAQDENSSHIGVINTNSNEKIQIYAQPDASLSTPPAEEEFVVEQALEDYRKAASFQVRQSNTDFHVDDRGLLIRKSIVDKAIQTVVSESLRNRILYISYFPPIAGHSNHRKMYETLRCCCY